MTLKNIFKIIKRDPVSLITNIAGLSFGLAASVLLTVFIQYEVSFDKHFSNSERIHRLNTIWINEGESSIMPICLRSAYTDIPRVVTGIETAVQIFRGFKREVTHGENRYKDLNLLYSDPDFFRLFDLKFVSGNPENVLSGVQEVVLTQELAIRIFGTDQVVGESIEMDTISYMVTAVIENIPANTHFYFDMLMPMKAVSNLAGLGGLEFFTYFMLEEGTNHPQVLSSICKQNTATLTERFADFGGSSFSSGTEPLEKLHLYTTAVMDLTPSGSLKTIIIMLVVAILVLVLALSNFINLYILNGARRSKEIGIRKVNGANRPKLILQFYLETTVVVTISFLFGAVLALILLPEFSRVMQRESFMTIVNTPVFYLMLLAVYVVTILLSGFYPALLLSKSDPVHLILGNVNPAGDKHLLLKLASIFQVTVTLFMLSILLGINAQTRHLKLLSPGYNPEGVVMLYNLNERLANNYPALYDRLVNLPGVEAVAASTHTIGGGPSGQGIRMYSDLPNQSKTIAEYRIHPGLCNLYQFNLKNGRFFDPDRAPDRSGVILNEAAVLMMGSTPDKIVGESVAMGEDPMEVIGVLEDFHYSSAANKIEPLMFTAYSDRIRNIPVRFAPGADETKTLELINEAIQSFDPDYIMINRYASDIYAGYYKGEERLRNILGAGSILSVIIVLLGIYALVSHNIVSRTKEIGIRKVMGGSTGSMLVMIYSSTLKWTALAAIIAVPLSWLYLNNWLQDYTVRIPLYWWIFAGSILLVAIFETLITLGQTWRTARKNPVEALRYE